MALVKNGTIPNSQMARSIVSGLEITIFIEVEVVAVIPVFQHFEGDAPEKSSWRGGRQYELWFVGLRCRTGA